jgi:hypothetical protein
MNTPKETAELLELVKDNLSDCPCDDCTNEVAAAIVGELQSKWKLTKLTERTT